MSRSRRPFICGSDEHEGDRIVAHPNDRYSKRVEYVRMDGKVRVGSTAIGHVCQACAEIEDAKLKGILDATIPMF